MHAPDQTGVTCKTGVRNATRAEREPAAGGQVIPITMAVIGAMRAIQEAVLGRTTRRIFLQRGVALLPLLACPGFSRGGYARGQDPQCPRDFDSVSRLLTGHDDLDTALSTRVWNGLVARDAGFPVRYRMLTKTLGALGVDDWRSYETSGLKTRATLHAVAVDIVGAWYLGRVGPMLPRAETGTPAFITYEGAMMWRPTLDVTVIPSYARGGPGSWAFPPSASAPTIRGQLPEGAMPAGRVL